jgi:hypothetical protein
MNHREQPPPVATFNQEVSFGNWRLDILATFEGRRKLVIVEVKAGTAGLEAVNQLKYYLEHWREMPLAQLGLDRITDDDVVGIVLAEEFVGIPDLPANIALVKCRFEGATWPFRVVPPSETLPQVLDDTPPHCDNRQG